MEPVKSKRAFIKRNLSLDDSGSFAVPLVTAHNAVDGERLQLQVVPESIEILKSIEKPVAVVAICGPYRTGKSYFLSRIIGDTECFTVGHSTEACTKGIWMATSVLECDDFAIVFFDSEGISVAEYSIQASINLLMTTALTSSLLIYNTRKPLQLNDVEKLRWCVTMSKHFQDKPSECQPSFLWLLRDMDLNVGSISPTEWLLKKLRAPRCKEITEALSNSFSSVQCAFLPPPAVKSEVLQNIIERRDELSPHFNEEIERIKNKIVSVIEPKHCTGGCFTGFSIASLIEECLTKMNNETRIPSLEATWKIAIGLQLQQFASKLVDEYESEMSSTLTGLLPLEEGALDSSDTSTLMGIHNQFLERKCLQLESKLVHLIPVKSIYEHFWESISQDFITRIIKKGTNGQIKGGKLALFQHDNYIASSELCVKTYTMFYDQIVASKLRCAISEGIPYDIAPELVQFEEKYNSIACGPAKSVIFSERRIQSQSEESKLLDIPGHVEELEIIGISSSRIKLKWCKPSVNPSAAHAYEVYLVREDGTLLLTETTTHCTVLLKNLKSNKEYTFVVRARNDQFLGSYVTHVSAKTTLTTWARSAIGIGTFVAFTAGSPVVFPAMFSVGTVSCIRSDVKEKKYAAAVAKSAALTLLPVALPFGVLGTIGVAPMIASDTFLSSGPKGDFEDNGEPTAP